MREFILLSRKGYTTPDFKDLRSAGRLDIVCACINSSIFLSHKIRKNVILNVILNGPSNPPLCICVNSAKVYEIRSDEKSIGEILRNVIAGRVHAGFEKSKKSFQELLREKEGRAIYILDEKGIDIRRMEIERDPIFILGDQIGLPKKEEKFAMRSAISKVSVGPLRYFASHCITIINNELDRRGLDG
ncbi:MAG: tRNA (pseudouridine(54)-N(1))-methyltransferase TrmY [Candidatus Parvarchaeota archaeon]|nr:tRNA (pseudouridine(54)-N(1))-methyltransferase TrmY [Candidatus Jingweiarchaeum tengchongense]MCW1298350.1 tRNA (pseudouridine(54)-N(1))-methyltransferase TrmY [Candidatus Jingweiarchaeum tengchongense]MCW1300348.1 tRNA (pseudouridine(54)-N(1))-methyltransferase TrmY [Candidatus Jingweiarchaeum tengchongense]MCW1304855.1 tRNA (pseudouridine(54)-N(1))-methyltransferase TrmY [Candidatus Jingweiarchaeum tengchongense]MCW1305844.1 tRNA (pseudouridine(54)-N(1))-methyltransferase TrmY [Candidatus